MPIPLKDEELLAQTEVNIFKNTNINELTTDATYNQLFLNENASPAIATGPEVNSKKFYLIMGLIISLALIAIICSLMIIRNKKMSETNPPIPPASVKEKPIYKKN